MIPGSFSFLETPHPRLLVNSVLLPLLFFLFLFTKCIKSSTIDEQCFFYTLMIENRETGNRKS